MARTPTRREKELAIALLLLSRKAAAKLVATLSVATAALVSGRAHISQAVHAIEASQATAIHGIRSHVRQDANKLWKAGIPDDVAVPKQQQSATDTVRAWTAASALAFAWSRAQRKLVQEDDLSEHAAMRCATAAVSSNAERTGVTETVHAWNAEISRLDDLAASDGFVVEETWSALIDACPLCADLDGETVVRPNRFPQDPPLHPWCRCTLISEVRRRTYEAA